MDLRQLRYFLAVAEELSFTRAAKRLHMSQPPLSQQMQLLERSLGIKLLNRTSRRVELTAAGQELQTQARAILAQTQQAEQQVRFIGAGRTGKIDIGATGATLRGGLAELLAEYRIDMPDVRTTIHEQAPALQLKAVLEYRTDVNFNRSIPPQEELASALAWRENVAVILPKGHRLARLRRVPLAELREDEHVMLHPDFIRIRALSAPMLRRCGLSAARLAAGGRQPVDPEPHRLRLRGRAGARLDQQIHQHRRDFPAAHPRARRRCPYGPPAQRDLARRARIRALGADVDGAAQSPLGARVLRTPSCRGIRRKA